MTDRVKGLYVALEKDIREDDVQSLAEAIRHMRWVEDVTNDVRDSDDYSARMHLRHEWHETMWKVLQALYDGRKITVEEPKEHR